MPIKSKNAIIFNVHVNINITRDNYFMCYKD